MSIEKEDHTHRREKVHRHSKSTCKQQLRLETPKCSFWLTFLAYRRLVSMFEQNGILFQPTIASSKPSSKAMVDRIYT